MAILQILISQRHENGHFACKILHLDDKHIQHLVFSVLRQILDSDFQLGVVFFILLHILFNLLRIQGSKGLP